MASVLPFADLAGLPLADYPHVASWYARLWQLDAWRDPFAGLEAPALPEVPRVAASSGEGLDYSAAEEPRQGNR